MMGISMQQLTLVFAFVLAPLAAHADQCDVKAKELTKAVPGVVAARQHDSGGPTDAVNLTTSAASEASIDCPTETGFPIDLFVAWDESVPSASLFDFAGRAGHIIVGAREQDIQDGAKICQQAELSEVNEEMMKFIHGSAYFECEAFGPDGGGKALSIYARKDALEGADMR